VDAACGLDISDDSVDRIPVHFECSTGVGAGDVGSESGLGVRSECMVLDDGHIQAFRLDDGADSHLAFTLGPEIEKAGTMKKKTAPSAEEAETLEIKADKKLSNSISRAEEDIQEKRLYSHREVFKTLEKNRTSQKSR
jgi:hypothetical protein